MSEWDNGISSAKMKQGLRDACRLCHCGKSRNHHTPKEVIQCKKEQLTDTTVTRMTEKEINGMRQARI